MEKSKILTVIHYYLLEIVDALILIMPTTCVTHPRVAINSCITFFYTQAVLHMLLLYKMKCGKGLFISFPL